MKRLKRSALDLTPASFLATLAPASQAGPSGFKDYDP